MVNEAVSRNVQEYLETIFTLTGGQSPASVKAISEKMNVAPPSVTEMLKKLAEKGYVQYSPYHGAILTDEGRHIGAKMTRKHRLLERFLHDVLKIGGDKVHKQACEMEHALSDEAEAALCQLLGHPSHCPDDGNPIHPCDLPFFSCDQCMKERNTETQCVGRRGDNLTAITELKEKEMGRVAFIRGGQKMLRRLLDMGLTPNTTIRVVRSAPLGGPVEIDVRGSKLALGRGVASNVFVEKCGI